MSARIYLIIALLVYFALAVYLSIKIALPKKTEIQAQVPKIEPISEEVFKSPVVSQTKSFVQFGQLPVSIDKAFQGKDNPFVP